MCTRSCHCLAAGVRGWMFKSDAIEAFLSNTGPLSALGLGSRRTAGRLTWTIFIPDRIHHQIGDRVKIELTHHIASMCFYRFNGHI